MHRLEGDGALAAADEAANAEILEAERALAPVPAGTAREQLVTIARFVLRRSL